MKRRIDVAKTFRTTRGWPRKMASGQVWREVRRRNKRRISSASQISTAQLSSAQLSSAQPAAQLNCRSELRSPSNIDFLWRDFWSHELLCASGRPATSLAAGTAAPIRKRTARPFRSCSAKESASDPSISSTPHTHQARGCIRIRESHALSSRTFFLSCSLAGCVSRECKGPKAKRIGLRSIPEGNWFCPTCAKAEFPKPGCNDNDPFRRTVLMCAIEDHKLRDDPDQPDVKHAYLTHLLNTPELESKLDLAHCDAEVSRWPEHMECERIHDTKLRLSWDSLLALTVPLAVGLLLSAATTRSTTLCRCAAHLR